MFSTFESLSSLPIQIYHTFVIVGLPSNRHWIIHYFVHTCLDLLVDNGKSLGWALAYLAIGSWVGERTVVQILCAGMLVMTLPANQWNMRIMHLS